VGYVNTKSESTESELPGKIMGLYNCAMEMLFEFLAWRKYKWSNLLKLAAAADLFI
jgi:hypothetical protein